MKNSISKPVLLFVIFCFALIGCSKDDTVKNRAPSDFGLINVADGTTEVALQPKLTWETANDPDGDNVSYQVYLDTQNPPQITIANNLEVSTFNVKDALQFGTAYYWMVIAKDAEGNTTKSNMHSFTTKEKTADAILGKWFLDSLESPGTPPLTACEKKSSYTFLKSGVIEVERYAPNSSDVCELDQEGNIGYEVISENTISITNAQETEIADIEIKDSVMSFTFQDYTIKFRR